MLSRRACLAAALLATAAHTAPAVAGAPTATLLGRAVLPAATFSPGPTSGQFITGANGVSVPFVNKQPVQGFSGMVPGPVAGTYDFILDNGFGAKANSADSLLRVFTLRPDFDAGTVTPANRFTGKPSDFSKTDWFFTLHAPAAGADMAFTPVYAGNTYPNGNKDIAVDPAIQNGRLLTGSDFDIEGIVRAHDGSYYFGDEFGPFIIHTNVNGQVNRIPAVAPNLTGVGTNPYIQSPDYPAVPTTSKLPAGGAANAKSSGGFEGFTINPAGSKLYTLLEKSLTGDANAQRRIINVFDTKTYKYDSTFYSYKVGDPNGDNAGIDPTNNSIGDMNMINDHQIVVIERDANQGSAAKFKRLYLIDLNVVDNDGFVQKTLLADLMNIADPNNKGGNGTTAGVFTMPFVTIENVMVVGGDRVIVVNDNNYPFSAGRTPNVPDDNEMVLLKLSTPLQVVCSSVNTVPCSN